MAFRTTSLSLTTQTIRYAGLHNRNIAKYQERLTTGLRINRPSDDPVGTRAILGYRGEQSRQTSELQNIQTVRTKLNSSVSRLLEAKDLLVSAKSIALQTSSNFERDVSAVEVGQLLDQMILVANTQVDDAYLFAGTATRTMPFEKYFDGTNEKIGYVGSTQRQSVVVAPSLALDTVYSGEEIFFAQDRLASTFEGATGASPGSGTNSAVGRQTLSVRHTDTSYVGTSGIQPGVSSAAADTVIGALGTHTLEINDTSGNGSAGTLSLNGGPTVSFTNADTDLVVQGPFGELIHVDTTNISAGFVGSVDLVANGVLTVDDGQTTAVIDFSANQPIIDARTGFVTHVDSRQIHQAGEEQIIHPGTNSVFEVLRNLRDDLQTSNGLSDAEWQRLGNQAVGELDRYISHILSITGEQSSALENLDSIETRNEDITLELQRIVADIESVDVTDAIVKLQTEQNLLQYTYSVTAQLFQLRLLDYV